MAKIIEFLKKPTYNNRTHGLKRRAGESCEHLRLTFEDKRIICRDCACEWFDRDGEA